MRACSLVAVLTLLVGGLACVPGGCAGSGGAPPRPARIGHVVFFDLVDPADRGALIADCDAKLAKIPGVVSYAAGRHLDVGRETVIDDYDVGLYIGFETEADYARYVSHPLHVELVEAWRPRLASLRVYDILDETE